MRSFELPKLPELREQRAIAATLGALDDKIESNRRLVGLIPQVIRARVDAALTDNSEKATVSSLARFVNGGRTFVVNNRPDPTLSGYLW